MSELDLDADEDAWTLSSEEYEREIATVSPRAPTLLPGRLASAVSLITATSSVGLRVGGFLGGLAINLAKAGTLTGFELSRVVFEGIISRAGQDVALSTTDPGARREAESVVFGALSSLHRYITKSTFLISAGFQIGATSLYSGLAAGQLLLSALDAIFGDTQTSRAVATIILLVQREFDDPHTGVTGQKVGLNDILVGTVAFAILQRWGEKQTLRELTDADVTEVVWDMVIVNDELQGATNDAEQAPREKQGLSRAMSFVSVNGTDEPFEAVEAFGDGRSFMSAASLGSWQTKQSRRAEQGEEAFRQAIFKQLKPGTTVSLSAESLSQDNVTLEIRDKVNVNEIEPPPGFTLIASEIRDGRTRLTFQRKRKRRRRGSFEVNTTNNDSQPLVIDDNMNLEDAPTTPMIESGDFDHYNELEDDRDCQESGVVAFAEPILANQSRVRTPLGSRSHSELQMTSTHDHDTKSKDTDPTPVRKSMRKGRSVKKLVDFWNRERHQSKTRMQEGLMGLGYPAELYNLMPEGVEHEVQEHFDEATPRPLSHNRHVKNRSSVYSLTSMASETSLVLHSHYGEDQSVASQLYRDGYIRGSFPAAPLTSNLARFSKFAIASYGATFLRLLTSWQQDTNEPILADELPEHNTFQSYIRLPPSSVLLSSYVDPIGGGIGPNDTEPGLPLVHFISVDHDSKAIVLTCRGTLGFEDVLTDMTGDYDDVYWLGSKHQVHRGVLASARRLLTLHDGRVLTTLKNALEEFEGYGLIFCGHSLGGAVAAIMAILIARPNNSSAGGAYRFVTAPRQYGHYGLALPINRPIHVYAYGPAACVSPSLQLATRGLITSVVHGRDVVPFLSLGTLIDFQAMALAFATDSHNAKSEVTRRVKDAIYKAFRDRTGLAALTGMFAKEWQQSIDDEEDHWPWIALKSLRASMLSDKLGPPGEIFMVESQPVLQRHAFVSSSSGNNDTQVEPKSFRPATHIKLQHVHNMERLFGEIKFGSSMFMDHFPSRYESVLTALDRGLGGPN